MEPAKRLQQVARRCLERLHELESHLFRHHVEVVEEKRHLRLGSPERSYFTAGYLQALKDVRELISQGEFPSNLTLDGGPRIPSSYAPPPPAE